MIMRHKYNNNYSASLLNAGTYDRNNLGDEALIHTIKCIQDGEIIITTLGGGTFTWNATSNENVDEIEAMTAKITVVSGLFTVFTVRGKDIDTQIVTPLDFWIDELSNNFADENGDIFILK